MTDPLFLVPPGSLDGLSVAGQVVLGPTESSHAVKAMRLQVGEPVVVADGRGEYARGEVADASTSAMGVTIHERGRTAEPHPRIVLVQALAKGDRDLLGIQTATEVGVDAVIPWQAQRSVVRLKSDKIDKTLAKWSSSLATAAKQARRTRVPELREPLNGTDVVRLVGPGAIVLVLDENAADSVATALDGIDDARLSASDDLVLVVGPEGGISNAELTALVEAGAHPVRMGDHVMRSSTAGPVAVALVQQLLSRW
ncbi:MAG: 16S rRNA (uracil(1498)-N(3))-methyltransferase [Micrococcaceae bacterium]